MQLQQLDVMLYATAIVRCDVMLNATYNSQRWHDAECRYNSQMQSRMPQQHS